MHSYHSTRIDYTIRLRQRSLTNYQYRFNNPDLWRVSPPDEEQLAHITTLHLLLKNSHDRNNAVSLLESTPSLSSLNLELHSLHADDFSTSEKFSRLQRGPRRLRSLRVQNICFLLGSSTIAGLVELEELEELQVIDCKEYNCLLRDMKSLPLKLKALCIHECDETTKLFNSIENDFLRSLSPMVRLSLTLGSDFNLPSSLLDWSALQAHAPALQCLRIKYTWPELPFSKFQSGFAQFCKAALSLKLLAISGVTVGNGDDDIAQFLVGNHMETVLANIRTDSYTDIHRCPTLAESPRAHCRHGRAQRYRVSTTPSFPDARDGACLQERKSDQENRGQDIFFACGQLS